MGGGTAKTGLAADVSVSAEGAGGVHDPILLFLHMFEISNHKITSKSTVLQKTLVSTHPASSFFY